MTTSDTDPDSLRCDSWGQNASVPSVVSKTTQSSAPIGDSYVTVAGDSENYDGFDLAVSDTVGAANDTAMDYEEPVSRHSVNERVAMDTDMYVNDSTASSTYKLFRSVDA